MKIDIVVFDLPDQKIISGGAFIDMRDDVLIVKFEYKAEELNEDTQLHEKKNRSYCCVIKKEFVIGAELYRVFNKDKTAHWKILFNIEGASDTYFLVKDHSEAIKIYEQVLKYIFGDQFKLESE